MVWISLIVLVDVLQHLELEHLFLMFLAVAWTVQSPSALPAFLVVDTAHFTFALMPLLLRCSTHCLNPEEILLGKEYKRYVPKFSSRRPFAFPGESSFLPPLPSECLEMSIDCNARLL